MAGRKSEFNDAYARIYATARQIPYGRVTTYGALAEAAGYPRASRLAARALSATRVTGIEVPWHRVFGKAGAYAVVRIQDPMGAALQLERIRAESVTTDPHDRISLVDYGWP